MTEQKSFKRLVRARMEKPGESYTAARARLLRAADPAGFEGVKLATSEETIRRRTGRGWEEWFELLDEWGAPNRTHRETARWLAEQQGLHPLAWNVQAVAASYERARGLRAVGEKDDGFVVTASRTVAVPVERLYEALVSDAVRERWLPDGRLRERTTTEPKSARFDWAEDNTRVNVTFLRKGEARSTVALEHRRLADAGEAERMKAYWRRRLLVLKATLES